MGSSVIRGALALLAVAIFPFSLSSALAAGRSSARGVKHPPGFKLMTKESGQGLRKEMSDTLNYLPLRKARNDFDVVSGCGEFGSDQFWISVAAGDDGNYLCAWVDQSTGYQEVLAQLFGPGNVKIGSAFPLSGRFQVWNSHPEVTFSTVTGEYLVTWAQTGFDIRLQRVSRNGELVGSNIIVNQQYSTNTDDPSAAVEPNGDILVTWYADETYLGKSGAYYRLLDQEGNPVTDQRLLLTGTAGAVSSFGWDVRVASDTTGNSVIVWSGFAGTKSQIELQVVGEDGLPRGGIVTVSDTAGSGDAYFPEIASTPDGHYLIMWSSDSGVTGRVFTPDSGLVSPEVTINNDPEWTTFSASHDSSGNFLILTAGNGAKGRLMSRYGRFIGQPHLLKTSVPPTYWYYPRITNESNGRVYIAYYGYIKNVQVVMVQQLDADFNIVGSPVSAGGNDCSSWQISPVVRYNKFGGSIIVWRDERDGEWDLYGQVFDKKGNLVSGNFIINDTSMTGYTTNPAVTSNPQGDFVVSFSGGNYSFQTVMVQMVSSTGQKIGGNRVISDKYYYAYDKLKPAVRTNADGDYLVYWYDENSLGNRFCIQRFDPYWNSYGPVEYVTVGSSGSPHPIISLSANSDFDILAMWADWNAEYETDGGQLDAMDFNQNGKALTDTMHLASLPPDSGYDEGACGLDSGGNTVFAWTEFSVLSSLVALHVQRRYSGGAIFRNVFAATGFRSLIDVIKFEGKEAFLSWGSDNDVRAVFLDDNTGSCFPMLLHSFSEAVDLPYFTSPYNSYGADLYDANLLFAYMSNADPQRGYDIWSNSQYMDAFLFGAASGSSDSSSTLQVSLPYPNPTNGAVNISYEVTKAQPVRVSVYNTLGQLVGSFDQGNRGPGIYYLKFSTIRLSSGVYFIRFTGDKTYTLKFMLIK